MSKQFDAIVIGSRFGGAITARRLAEKGDERPGPRARPPMGTGDVPAQAGRSLDLQQHEAGAPQRLARHALLQAHDRRPGGRSRRWFTDVHSGVALEANPDVFTRGWPAEITYAELKPYSDMVAKEMNLQVVPDGQLTPRFKVAREAAHNLGYDNRFSKANLAVSFSPDWHYGLEDAFDPKHSTPFVNAHGQRQGTCIHLGNCDVGCDVRAKNTLDVNYIPRAEQHGADVRPLHMVRYIEPRDGEYRVVFDRIQDGQLIRGEEYTRRVIVAAGSLGTTELLLRCRDDYQTLPALSPMVGKHWSPNANFLSLGNYSSEKGRVKQSTGPSISSVLDFTDGSFKNQRFAVEDDGFPNVILNALKGYLDNELISVTGNALL